MPGEHKPSTIAEIDVARPMRGRRLAPYLLSLLTKTHPEDPHIDLEVYEGNERATAFYRKLGFSVDRNVPLRRGKVYAGQWITMRTTGREFFDKLPALLPPV